jgi:anaerobic ribonucleoside-triphosphate reductase activating protein
MDEKNTIIKINQVSTGFIEVPNQVSLNIYAQGCTKRCSGCQNIDLQSFIGGQELNLKDVDSLLNDFSLCTWICWLGGDAYYQQESLKEFNKKFKNKNLKVCLYTGVLFDTLDESVLENLDLVIDGEWKGIPVTDENSNQKVWIKDFESKWSIISWKSLQEIK